MLATNETPTSTHMGDTPESFRPHTNFGMAVGSMQTWNLSWLFTNIEYFFIRCYYWNIWDNPSTIVPQGLQGPGGSLTLRHWRYCGGSPAATITWQLLYYCQKKAYYEHLSSNQSCVVESCCFRAAAAAAAATVFVQMIQEKKNLDLNKHPLCWCKASNYSSLLDGCKRTVGHLTK